MPIAKVSAGETFNVQNVAGSGATIDLVSPMGLLCTWCGKGTGGNSSNMKVGSGAFSGTNGECFTSDKSYLGPLSIVYVSSTSDSPLVVSY